MSFQFANFSTNDAEITKESEKPEHNPYENNGRCDIRGMMGYAKPSRSNSKNGLLSFDDCSFLSATGGRGGSSCETDAEMSRTNSGGKLSQRSLEIDTKPGIYRLNVHSSIIGRLNQFICKKQIPHIIFHGPSGAGKLTLVRDFILRIYEGDVAKTKTHVMTVNCSHGKGIQFIREELKFFAKANAQTKSQGDFKIILLINAHHLTVDAQSALRRCIELFSYNTRFFIVVENKNKLLNPILSRFCDVFVPEPVDPETGETINLHKYVLSQQFKLMNREDDIAEKFAILDAAFSEMPAFSEQPMTKTVNSLYESGISCLDFMEWVGQRRDKWSALDHSRAIMRFYQIKPQFRCEKLLLLYMVNLLYYT